MRLNLSWLSWFGSSRFRKAFDCKLKSGMTRWFLLQTVLHFGIVRTVPLAMDNWKVKLPVRRENKLDGYDLMLRGYAHRTQALKCKQTASLNWWFGPLMWWTTQDASKSIPMGKLDLFFFPTHYNILKALGGSGSSDRSRHKHQLCPLVRFGSGTRYGDPRSPTRVRSRLNHSAQSKCKGTPWSWILTMDSLDQISLCYDKDI